MTAETNPTPSPREFEQGYRVREDTITVRLPCELCGKEAHGLCQRREVVARRLWWCEEHDQKCWPDGCHQFGLEEECRMVEVFMGPIPE